MNYLNTLLELNRLRKQAKFSPERIKKLQDRKLRRLLHYAWEHSAYYRRTFELAGITEDQLDTLPLSCFPTMDKQALLTHFDELITLPEVTQEELRKFDEEIEADRKPYNGKYHVVHSSGREVSALTISRRSPDTSWKIWCIWMIPWSGSFTSCIC